MRILSFLILLFFIACSSSKLPEPGRFKVTVSTDGKEVKDYNQSLVHRVTLNKKDLRKLFGNSPEKFNCKSSLKTKKDFEGKAIGLKVKPEGIESLGLEGEDVIVAIGANAVNNKEDFWHLKELIEIKGEAELTIIRNGRPNKILLAIND